MEKIFDSIELFLAGGSIWVYLCIFFGRLLDVSAATLRIVLVNRGERLIGSLVAFIEIIIWLLVARSVLVDGVSPLKVLVYAVAFALGTYVGSWLEEKLAFGLAQVQIVIPDHEKAATLQKALHDGGFGVTAIDVHGADDEQRYMLITYARRKMLPEAMRIVNSVCDKAVISVSDVKTQKGGYIRSAFGKRKA